MSEDIRKKALERFESRNYVVIPHAHQRMIQQVTPQPKGRYKFRGCCMDERTCQVVIEFENGLIIK